MAPSFPLAFGFSNLAMLGWLGAAAAPILIHLWMRHTHRDTPWAAMEFLREAIKRNARRLKLQQWLLLAVRTLLLLLLALAAAKPYLSGWSLLTGGPKVHRILVLDASMSMQYSAGDESVFERARQLATEAVEQSGASDVYSLLLLASPPQTIIAGPVADARGVTTQLQSLEPTYGDASVGELMTTIANLISESEATHRDLSRHEVLLFTDLANSTWQQATGDSSAVDEIRELAERAKLTIVDLGPTEPTNVSAHDTRIVGTLATIVEPLRIECDVTNFGGAAKSDVVVELLQDGTSIDEQTVTLPAGGSTTVTFDAKIAQAGWTSLAVRTSDDALTPDDVGWLAVDVRERVRALLVEGESGAARYLRHALEPGQNLSPIEATVVSESALTETPLEDFDAIFLCNVAQFTANERELLARYVERGGTLVFFLGDRVLAETYNEVLASVAGRENNSSLSKLLYQPRHKSAVLKLAQSAGTRDSTDATDHLLPVTIGRLETSNASGINPLDYAHPIAAAFRGSERAGLLSTPVNRFYQLIPREGAEVALALPTGEPLIVTAASGRGMVAVVATSATLDTVDPTTTQPWTLMPAWPSFLPIVRELVAYGMGASRLQSERTIGDFLEGRLPENWHATTVAVTRPDGRKDIVPVERGVGGAEWSYASSDEPGVYVVQDAASSRVIAKIAVNVPSDESNVVQVDTKLLPDVLAIRAATHSNEPQGAQLLSDTSLHRTLLYFVLALLLIEPVMAWVFAGRGA